MSESIQRLFQFIYTLFQISFYYWIYLLRGVIVYSFIPATAALWETTKIVLFQPSDEETKEIFRECYNKYRSYRGVSFAVTILLVLLQVALFYLNRSDLALRLAFMIVLIYLAALLIVNVVFVLYYFIFYHYHTKDAFALAFVTSFKKPLLSIAILLCIVVLYLLLYWNLIAFLAFGPCLFSISMSLLFRNFKHPFHHDATT
ncbi:hypothetical protein MUN88_20875 [Gracilibacillus caseinilyticus]|uniref:Membrane protein YesL n=1 Tax=Gracilibacillus caseinilyticus TaxID=2932256 RepID=A0ABY4EVZ7_9BACI|nr:hypothetical protein [Gracilibacillus caseinilyticus]UOQ48454.1 hypothetical protein MUN88_20875 [Gracilibacillus caseinilyticus]